MSEINEYVENDPLARVAQDRQQRLQGSLATSVDTNPDAYAAQRQLAKYVGVPPIVAQTIPDEIKRRADVQRVQADITNAPVLQRKYSEADFAKLAHDDSGVLSQIGSVVRALGEGVIGQFAGGTVSGVSELLDLGARAIDRPVRAAFGNRVADAFWYTPARFDGYITDPLDALRTVGTGLKAAGKAIGPADDQRNFATDVAGGLGQVAGQVALALATGGTASLFQLWAQGADQMADKVGKDNASQINKDLAILSGATVTAVTEKYALDKLLGPMAEPLKQGVMKFLANMGVAAASEGAQETLESLAQDVLRKALTDPNAKIDVLDAAYSGGVGFTVGGIASAVLQATLHVKARGTQAQRAEQDAERLAELQKLISTSKLADRSPADLAAVVNEMASDAKVRFDGARLAEVFNQAGLDPLVVLPGVTAEDLQAATESGGEVSVSVGELTTAIRGTPLEQTLLEHARLGDNDLSAAEARAVQQEMVTNADERIARAVGQAQDQAAAQASSDVVRASILGELNTAGRHRLAVNEGLASWATAFYTTMASRTGMTAEQFYAAHRLRILAEPSAQGQGGFEQPGGLDTLRQQWADSGIQSAVSEKAGVITLSQIVVPEAARGVGHGTAAMQQLVAYADRTGQSIALSASSDFGGSKKRLTAFYKRFGFVENKGKNRAFTVSEGMYRAAPGAMLEQSALRAAPVATLMGDEFGAGLTGKELRRSATTLVRQQFEGQNYTNGSTGELIQVRWQGLKHALAGANDAELRLLAALPQILERSQYAGQEPDKDARPDIVAVHKYTAVVQLGSEQLDVGVIVREHRDGQRFYDQFIVGKGNPAGTSGATPGFSQQLGDQPTAGSLRSLSQPARGTFNPASLELVLAPGADLSTFFHETGHFFLEVMADIASQPNAPVGIVDDWNQVLNWFGVTDEQWRGMSLDEQRQHHERWAEGIEQYVMEGKSPSAEMAPLMRRFRVWMLSVYKSLKQFVAGKPDAERAPLNDDIRRVMDRLLATDEQIQQANEIAGFAPDEQADGQAAERLGKRSIADLKWAVKARDAAILKIQKEAAAIEKDTRAEVTVEVDQTPEMRAKNALDALQTTPEYPALVADWTAQRAAAQQAEQDRLKAELLAANPEAQGLKKGQLLAKNRREMANKAEAAALAWEQANPKPKRAVNATDEDIATIADSFGFESVDQMLQAIDAFGSRAEAIDALTERRMLEQHGDLVDERAIRDAANEAVHNEARARSLATELRTQAEMLNTRTDTGEVNAAGSKITVNALMEAAKQFGARIVARTPIKDLRSKSAQHTAAERRAGKAWTEATAKGDTAAAVQAKRDQVLNNAAAKAALDAIAEGQKIVEFFRTVAKGSNEKMVGKGRDPDVVNAARAVLAAYGVETPTTKRAADYLETLQRNDPETAAVIQPMIDSAMQNAQPLTALTFEELQSLHEEIQAMWHLSRRMRQMEVGGDLMDIEDAADELHARLETVGIPDEAPGTSGALTRADERKRKLQFFTAILRRVEQWTEKMDGKFGGPFSRLVFQPIKEAAERYRADRISYRKQFQALVDAVAPAMTHRLIEAPELGYTFGRGHNGIGHAELLHAILHTGNDSNKRKLLLGRKWASENMDGTLDTSRWDAFTKRLADTGVLQKVHYDFAQGVWDLLETTKPLAQKAHRDVFGRYFEEVTANSFEDPFGNARRGGYVPAQADPNIVDDANLRALAEMENKSMAFSFPTTGKGFTKGRVEYNRPLKLDLRTIPQHIDKVLLFSHMTAPAHGVNRLLRQPGVAQPLGRIDPSLYAGMLLPWLHRAAKQLVETPAEGDGGVARIASVLRSRAGAALMFANVSNTVQQLTGFVSAFGKIKSDGLRSQMLKATALMVSSPKAMRQAVANASVYMANRMDGEVARLTEQMNEILLDPSLYERAQAWSLRNSYFLQQALDNSMGPIIWTAAYNGALEKGVADDDAVRYADSVIRQTQGDTSAEGISRMEGGGVVAGHPAARIFTQFISYFNMLANTNATALQQVASEVGLKKGAGRALGVVFFGMLAPLWVADAIAQAFRGGPGDADGDGEDNTLIDWIAAVLGMGTIKGLLAQVPFAGQLANAAINRFNGNPADDRVSLSPAVSLLESAGGVPFDLYKHAVGEGNTQRTIRDSAALVSLLTGLPATAAARPLGYLAGIADDKISPTGPADAARGLITGVASPESKNK